MRIVVVDDEKEWRDKIRRYIENVVDEDLQLEIYESGEEFLKNAERYDIIFMDVEMEGMSGLEATKRYKEKYPDSHVAMLTSHYEMADQGYIVDAYRYISKDKMQKGIQEALADIQTVLRDGKKIVVNIVMRGKYEIAINNISYVEVLGRKTVIHVGSKQYECTETLQEICDKLEREGFYRCHQSFLVNLDDVEDYNKEDIFLKNGKVVMLSKRQRKGFEDAYFKRTFQCANK